MLTLFVLLLAYQDVKPESGGADAALPVAQAAQADLSVFNLLTGENIHGDFGHSGAGLLPLDVRSGYPVADAAENLSAEPALIEPAGEERSSVELAEHLPAEENPVVAPQEASPQPSEALEVNGRTDSLMPAPVEEITPLAEEIVGPLLPTPAEKIHYAFSQSPLQEHVDLSNRAGAVSVEISDNILFGLASAAVSAEGQQLLNELAAVLATLPYELSVEGHTDNVPISSSRFPSNWELSSARAAMATRVLIEQGIAADRLRAVGYGDTRPRADNLTPEGRAKNRRVSFVLHVEDTLID